MAIFETERVLRVHHWNETLFSFTTTRSPGFRFQNGHFVTLGLEVEGRPLVRAYSIASTNYEEHLEFLSIKVPGGPLTSRLQHLKAGDPVLMGRKPAGSLVISDLPPGRCLYLLCTGTGLAPFMSIVRDPDTYERFGKVVLVHGVRRASELAYRDLLAGELARDEYIGEQVRQSLLYCPTVTREAFARRGRVTELLQGDRLTAELGLPRIDPTHDRVMICGSPEMMKDTGALLDLRGFRASAGIGQPGGYVFERAFAEK